MSKAKQAIAPQAGSAMMPAPQTIQLAPIAEVRAKLEDRQYLQLIKDALTPQASDVEFRVCMATAHHLGLDPLARQIFFIPVFDSKLRREQFVPVVAVAGLLAIAQRTGEYLGRTKPQWCGQDGEWRDLWLADGPPAAAQVGVYRDGFIEATTGVVMFREYCRRTKDGRPMAQWGTQPAHMLFKCALSQALRHSFPQEMAGDYGIQEISMPGEPGRFRTRDDTPQLTDGQAEADDNQGILALIKEVRNAPTLKALDKATQALKDCTLGDSLREAAKNAWVEASERLAKAEKKPKKNGKAKAEPEPEPAPAGEHDYGPPPMTDDQVKAAEASFGFSDTEGNTK